jgi:hypothetical protein
MMASLGFNDDEEDSKISDAVSTTRPIGVGAGTTSRGNKVGKESKDDDDEVASSDNNNNNDDLLDLMDAL